jgi:aldehyde dehydrogenase (NAD+)
MRDCRQFYINGQWVEPIKTNDLAVENPATEKPIAVISRGSSADVDRAVLAARQAFPHYSQPPREDRLELLERLLAIYLRRYEEMAEAIQLEMGAPVDFARNEQADCGRGHLQSAINALKHYPFEQSIKNSLVVKEPIGVCGMITPWNWPINQIACKVAPALATGCTMVLKPSEIAPLSAYLFAEMIAEAGYPPGVFNLINGCGTTVGAAIAAHPDIDMISFTGSTRAGIAVAKAAADSVKRVAQELGGKSPNILLDDANFESAIKKGIFLCMENTGQSCNAPTRMLIPESRYPEALMLAKDNLKRVNVDYPDKSGRHLGPLASRAQYEKVQQLIQIAIDEGATLLAGGPGKPDGFETGHFVKPTIFADVSNDMTIAREEVFGPVLVMIPYKDNDDAISIANDTPYGLSAYIQTSNINRGKQMARKLRAGMVRINHAPHSYDAPFGGYKQSGNGREWGEYGFDDYLEIKAISL